MKTVYRTHAIQRMAERSISKGDVDAVLSGGNVIENYPTSLPYPAALLLGFRGSRPIHVVAAWNAVSQTRYVISVYEPDPTRWEADFKTRRRKP